MRKRSQHSVHGLVNPVWEQELKMSSNTSLRVTLIDRNDGNPPHGRVLGSSCGLPICVERRVTQVREYKWTHEGGKWLCWLAKGLKRERQESREQGVLQKTDLSSEHQMTIIYPRLEYSSLSICPTFFLPFLSLPDVLNLRTQPSKSAAQSLLMGEPTCKHYLNIEIVILFCAVSPVTSSTWYRAGS